MTSFETNDKARRSLTRWAIFLILGVVVSLIVLEGVLHVASFVSPEAATVLNPHAGLLLPDDRLIHRPNPAIPEHDAWGFRNASVPDRAFAVALGDSQTYGGMVPRKDAWPQQLAEATGETVYNMAFGGYDAGEASLLLEQALELNPKQVLYGLYAGNDLLDAYELAYKTDSLKDWRTTDAAVLTAINAAESDGAIKAAFRKTHSGRVSIRRWLGDHCMLYGLARAARNAARGSAWQESEISWDAIIGQREAHPDWVVFENAVSPTVMTPQYRLFALNRDDPRIREGERITLALLTEMAARCAKAGAQFGVVALPTKELVHLDAVQKAGGEVDARLKRVWRDEAALWDACKTACAENGIPLIDTLAPLRASLHTGERPFRRDSDGHLTRSGNRVVAEAIAGSL